MNILGSFMKYCTQFKQCLDNENWWSWNRMTKVSLNLHLRWDCEKKLKWRQRKRPGRGDTVAIALICEYGKVRPLCCFPATLINYVCFHLAVWRIITVICRTQPNLKATRVNYLRQVHGRSPALTFESFGGFRINGTPPNVPDMQAILSAGSSATSGYWTPLTVLTRQ